MATWQKVRRLVLTGAVTAVTIAGTLYGAGVKIQQDVSEVNQRTREATIDERIQALRNTRENLQSKKELVDKQIYDLDARIEDRKRKGLVTPKAESPRDG